MEGQKQVLKKFLITGVVALWLLSSPLMGQALAAPFDAEAAVTNAQTAADTGFILMSSALVLLMTPGLAFFIWRICAIAQHPQYSNDELLAYGNSGSHLDSVGI